MSAHVSEHGLKGDQWELVLVAEIKGYQVLWIQTASTRVELVISPKGRKIRVESGLLPVNRLPKGGQG